MERDSIVAETEASERPEIEDESAKLSESLKTCRTVLESYRVALTGGEPISDEPTEPALEPSDGTQTQV
jgi:hypothetical protein